VPDQRSAFGKMRGHRRRVEGALRQAPVALGLALALSGRAAAQAPQPAVLCSFEDLAGATITWGEKFKPQLALSRAEAFVTEGRACVHISATVPADAQGNSYIGFRLPLAVGPVDVRHALLFLDAATTTPQATEALYLRAYDDQGRRVCSWVNWSRPLTNQPRCLRFIPGFSAEGFNWEADLVEAGADLSRLAAIELIIGTTQPGATLDAYFDNLRLQPTQLRRWQEITGPKPRYPETVLVAEGRPRAVVLAPEGAEWGEVAVQVRQAIARASGVELPVRLVPTVPKLLAQGKLPPAEKESALDASEWGGAPPRLGDQPVAAVLVGNVADNAAFLYLYTHEYTWADHAFPGPGGFELATVHDPWGVGLNAVIVGASDVAGGRAAAARLASLLPKPSNGRLALPPLLEINLGAEAAQRFGKLLAGEPDEAYLTAQQQAAERALRSGEHTGLWGRIASAGEAYARTRKPGYARLFVWLVRRAYQHYQSQPATFGGPWGMDSDFMVHRVIPAWDAVEEEPSLTDAERWEITRILFQWVSEVAVRPAASTVGSSHVRHNHQTFPALGLLYAADYFGKYYHLFEAEEWLRIADACFQFQAECFKPHEDCNGYQWLTLGHLARYSLTRPNFAYFRPGPLRRESSTGGPPSQSVGAEAPGQMRPARWACTSNAARDADYAVLGMDSFAYSTTYGDTGEYQGWWTELPFLRAVNFVLRDPAYQWVIDRKAAVSGYYGLGEFSVRLPAQEPSRLAGALAFPVDETWWRNFEGPSEVPWEAAVDKVCVRSGFAESDQYVLLDGLNGGGHGHYDGNSISRWCAGGRIWLADADYFRAAARDHSTAIVLREGLGGPRPRFTSLLHLADLPAAAASETVAQNYNGCDWHRWLLAARRGAVLVADRFVARVEGDYDFHVLWQCLGEARLQAGRLDLEQAGQWAAIVFPPDARAFVSDDPAYGANWARYPYLRTPVVRLLRLVYSAHLRAGEEFIAWSLLSASGPKPSQAQLQRLGQREVVVRGEESFGPEGVWGAGLRSWPPGVAGSGAQAAAWLLTPRQLFLVDSGGADVQADLATGKLVVQRPAGTRADAAWTRSEATRPAWRLKPAAVRAVLLRPRQAPAAAAPSLPPKLQPAWQLWPQPAQVVLTGNLDTAAAADCLVSVHAEPQPLEANLFDGQPGLNQVRNLFDGNLTDVRGCVMWAADQPVTLTLQFDAEYELRELQVRAWWASSSSKRAAFALASLSAEVSSDGFRQDVRAAGRLVDEQAHEDWGGRAHLPELYRLDLQGLRARQLRLRLIPRPGTAVYLAELYVYGRGGPLSEASELARRLRRLPHFTCLAPVEAGGEVLVAAGRSDGELWLIAQGGQVRWQKALGKPVRAVAAVRFDGQHPVIVAGCADGVVVALGLAGEELWRCTLEYYKRAPHVNVVLAARFAGDGRQSAVVGAENWRYYALDGAGKILWQYEAVHLATAAAAADLTGDGRDEVVLGTNYYWWHAVKPEGARLWEYSTKAAPECSALAAGDVDGTGRPSVFFGVADGTIQAVGANGSFQWMIDLGDRVTALHCADLNGDGRAELLAASANSLAYAFNGEGKLLWRRGLGEPITAGAYAPGVWACGCQDGTVWVLRAADGAPRGCLALPGPILACASASDRLFACSALGALACCQVPQGE
jgi:hypothetical protein